MKSMILLLLAIGVTAFAQNLDRLTPAERQKLQRQNEELKSLLLHSPKLPFDQTEIKGWTGGKVSWVASDRNGLIYLLQRGNQADPVIVLDRSGRVLRSWGKGLYTTPHSIRIDPQGDVWTTDAASSMVYKFSAGGKILLQIEVGGQPTPRTAFCSTTDVAFAPNGHVFISDGYANARILEYTPGGQKIREWGAAGTGPGQFRIPHSIQIDEQGVIYVADRENGRIQRFDLEGKYLGEWPQYGKTFGLKLAEDALWLSGTPRGPNGAPGWLIKVNRATGAILGYIDTMGTHGLDVMPGGDLISATPLGDTAPLYRSRK